MTNLDTHSFDAIVVGSGISGGWAAKELTEKGLRTLLLERGRDVPHGEYPTAFSEPWDFENRGDPTPETMRRKPKQNRTGFATRPAHAHWFVDDLENPYEETQRFDWIRGHHVGGRSIMWGRQSYRLGDLDFEANARDGFGVDWPLRYADLAPWYDHVERFAGISGLAEGLPQLPDGQFLPPMEMNVVERHVRERIAANFGGRVMTIGRTANLTQAHNGRAPCQYRNRCMRGCPYGAYFSSNSATLPAAYATGRLTLRPHSIVTRLQYDADRRRVAGVHVLDATTGEALAYRAKIIFLCASTVASTAILLNSRSDRFPKGLGNDSDELGHNLMDHHFQVGATGRFDKHQDRYYRGRRPNGVYIPRFRNLGDQQSKRKDYFRGFGYQGRASRMDWTRGIAELARFGRDFKADLIEPGAWRFGIGAWGEMLPYHENRMHLNHQATDRWGQPQVVFDCAIRENELLMRRDAKASAVEMLESAGCTDISAYDNAQTAPGLCIHEMGTARMGRDPKTSVLNAHNQIHSVPNVFVTDGSCMTSSACVNPSLTYMALTARAADHAVQELNRQNL
jgi:choline dehydrogenase-like flavoprotein